MRVFLDTSILVAALVEAHEHHARAFPVLERVQNGADEGHLAGHGLAEVYSILTKLPAPFRHTPEQALLSIDENVVKYFQITVLSGNDYSALLREAAIAGVQGGTIYDAVLLKCSLKSRAERIWTFNLKHFRDLAPENVASRIAAP